jgi:acyl-CoA dehydrogenase family member 9
MADSFMKSLFSGAIADSLVFPYPEPTRSESDEVHALCDGIRRFGRGVDSAAIDRDEHIPDALLDELRALGGFGWLVPREHGGAGLSTTASVRLIQELAGVDLSLAVTLASHQSIGLSALLYLGSDELKARYLPKLASGEMMAAFALSEATAGSDASGIRTRADRDGDDYVLRGEKVWVTNGSRADLFTVFARTSPAEDGAKPRITAFLVERGPGVTTGAAVKTLGVRGASVTSLSLDGVRVPESHVIGEVGRGFRVAMEVLNRGRLALAGSSIGASKELLRLSVERAKSRKAFGRALSEFALVKDKLASMAADIFAVESATYLTTGLVDGEPTDYSIESAICKVISSEGLWRVANETLQIVAGVGYMRDQPYERMLRDARLNLVFAGTNEILRCFIALSGMQEPGKDIQEASRALREPIKGFGLLSDFALKKARSALGRDRVSKAHATLSRESVLLEDGAAQLARNVDKVLRRHGKEIAEMQYTQRRAADVAIDLYALAACVSRTTRAIERRGEEGARREIELTSVFAGGAEKRIASNLASFDRNDDELRKAVAAKVCVDKGYPLDVI